MKRGQEEQKRNGEALEVGSQDSLVALHLRLKVENQRSVLQPHGVAADCVVNDLCGCKGRLSPVKVDRR